ncbi:MAG: MafI family immunity protein [bacterium]
MADIPPGRDLQHAEDFIEHNEHSLAFDVVVAVLKRDRKAISSDLFEQLMKLSNRFQYNKAEPGSPEADCWQSIQKFAIR